MTFDNHVNWAYALVATAPSPATSGTSLGVTTGFGDTFGTPPFNVIVWAAASDPTDANAEIVRVTNISTDTFTIVRGGTSGGALNGEPNNQNRSIVVGDQIATSMTAKTFTDIEAFLANNKLNIPTGSNAAAGTGTLSGGTATISTTAVTSSSLIFLTDTASSVTNVGTLTVSAKSAGTSFTVTSANVLDSSTFNWLIVN